MEPKKTPKADLQNKRSIFLLAGIALSLLIIIGLFSWSQKERVVEVPETETVAVETEVVEVTVQEDKRPPAPIKTQAVTISEMLNIVRNDARITEAVTILDLDITEQTAVDVGKFGGTYTGEDLDDEPVIVAEDPATFMGGDVNAFSKWVQKNIKYPASASSEGVGGNVQVQFIVEKDGTIKTVKIMNAATIDKRLAAEAQRVILSCPTKWSPAKNRGKPVRQYVSMPVRFVIE